MNNTGLIKGIHNAIDIIPVTANKLNALLKSVTKAERNWAEVNQFKANSGQLLMHANEKGQVSSVWLGVEDASIF